MSDLIVDGLRLIAGKIAAYRGTSCLLTSNSGEPEFSNDVFAMRSYCWCEGERHPDGCPPNFEHHASGLSATWYKHANRGNELSEAVSPLQWAKIIQECLASIPDTPHDHARVPMKHPWATNADYWECACGAYGFGDKQYTE